MLIKKVTTSSLVIATDSHPLTANKVGLGKADLFLAFDLMADHGQDLAHQVAHAVFRVVAFGPVENTLRIDFCHSAIIACLGKHCLGV